ncbi:hypothetical protein AHAS_Ahas19G0162200 [Arachis hypogaea]
MVGNTERGRNRKHGNDSRIWNREEHRRLEHDSFSIFVDNLPQDISKKELFQLFNWTGRINDIYLSRKQKGDNIYIFAFIYTTKGGALKAIKEMNRMKLRGKVVFVGEAKYRRISSTKDTKSPQRGKDDRNKLGRQPKREEASDVQLNTLEVRKEKKEQDPNVKGGTKKKIEVTVAKENLDWLQRSLIGGMTKAIDFCSLKDMIEINMPQVIQVRELGAYKALLTFDSMLSAEETYTFKMNSLLQIFHSVWRWEEAERSETRRVWLECFGVPLHVWSANTFKMIGGQWGKVVGCDNLTESRNSFSVGHVQIDTSMLDVINEWIHITVGLSGFDVLVKEVGRETYGLGCKLVSMDDGVSDEDDSERTQSGILVSRLSGLRAGVKGGKRKSSGSYESWARYTSCYNKGLLLQLGPNPPADLIETGTGSGAAGGLGSFQPGRASAINAGARFSNPCVAVPGKVLQLGPNPPADPFETGTGSGAAGGLGSFQPGRASAISAGARFSNPCVAVPGKVYGDGVAATNGHPCSRRDGEGGVANSGDIAMTPGVGGCSPLFGTVTCAAEEVVRLGDSLEKRKAEEGSIGLADGDRLNDKEAEMKEIQGSATRAGGGDMHDTDENEGIGETSDEREVAETTIVEDDNEVVRETGMRTWAQKRGIHDLDVKERTGSLASRESLAQGRDEGAGAAREGVDVENIGGTSDNLSSTLEEQMLENKRTWDLAVESGAILYDEEGDIMAILQAQNEENAQKRLAKQKVKARRSRPKNSKKGVGGDGKSRMVKDLKTKNRLNMLGLVETKKHVVTRFDVARYALGGLTA